MNRTPLILLVSALVLSNLIWAASYRALDASYIQEQGLRDEADTLLRAQMPYDSVDCDNANGDPRKCTVEPDEPCEAKP